MTRLLKFLTITHMSIHTDAYHIPNNLIINFETKFLVYLNLRQIMFKIINMLC